MKLRNKKTGEIADLEHRGLLKSTNNNQIIVYPEGTLKYYAYNSLAELNEEWEDYEEPKGYWYYDTTSAQVDKLNHNEDKEIDSSIGNCFETREEAKKAVEKLKAWKRLKDKGAKFYGWGRNHTGTYELYLRWEDRVPRSYEVKNDIDLLFGGEDE